MRDEARLIDQARQGDSVAFGQLVRRFQDRLYTSMVHVTGCQNEAEDVVQEAFVQAYVKLHTFRQGSSFYTWLYRIALNLARSQRRRKRPDESVEAGREMAGAEPLDGGDTPGEQLLRAERVRHVQAALAALSEPHRAIIVLREIEGFDYARIAVILNISVGTVRSRLARARLHMRDLLKELHPEHQAD